MYEKWFGVDLVGVLVNWEGEGLNEESGMVGMWLCEGRSCGVGLCW